LRQAGENRFAGDLLTALQAYSKENSGQLPTDISQLAPFLSSSADPAILQRWTIVPASSEPRKDWGITQKGPVDKDYDTRIAISLNRWETQPWSKTGSITVPLRR